MREITLPANEISENSEEFSKAKLSTRKKWRYTLFISISAACVLVMMGILIIVVSDIGSGERADLLNRAGTFLVLFAAPLYFLAAHCLDKLDFFEKKKKNDLS